MRDTPGGQPGASPGTLPSGRHAAWATSPLVMTAGLKKTFGLGLLAACILIGQSAFANTELHAPLAPVTQGIATTPIPATGNTGPEVQIKRAHFAAARASDDARNVANWIVHTGNNQNLPFLIIDKKHAQSFAFDAQGQIKGETAILLGSALGDDSAPGIGEKKLSQIRPDERSTPAGRFMATLGRNLKGEEILWVDYETSISLHRVITSNKKERRAERLASSSVEDNRISYGCINVPVKYYEEVVSPLFRKMNGVVYVLPETRSARETFGFHNVDEPARNAVATSN